MNTDGLIDAFESEYDAEVISPGTPLYDFGISTVETAARLLLGKITSDVALFAGVADSLTDAPLVLPRPQGGFYVLLTRKGGGANTLSSVAAELAHAAVHIDEVRSHTGSVVLRQAVEAALAYVLYGKDRAATELTALVASHVVGQLADGKKPSLTSQELTGLVASARYHFVLGNLAVATEAISAYADTIAAGGEVPIRAVSRFREWLSA